VGSIEILAGAAGYSRINFIFFAVTNGVVVLPTNLSVQAGQSVPLNVQLSAPAPTSGAFVTLQSGNPAIATTSPSNVYILPGATTPATAPQLVGVANGTTTLIGFAAGFGSDTETVVVGNPSTMPTATCSAVTSGQVGVAFNSGAIGVSGGASPYTFSIIGMLPTGLTLNTGTGAVTGTPQASGSFSIRVTDSKSVVATTTCPITIGSGVITLACPSANSFQAGVSVNSPAIGVSGAVSPLTFSVASGAIPSGLNLNASTGALTGTPSTAGSFTLQVKDANGTVAATTCPFTVTSSVLAITSTSLPSASLGSAYSFQPQTTGGKQPFVWTMSGLPRSFSYNPYSGLITGTANVAGTYSVSMVIFDSSNPQQMASAILTFVVGATPLAFTTPSALPNAVLGVAYLQQITAAGGQTFYNYSVSNLPSWLTFDVNGTICGLRASVCGTPATTGTSSFTVTVIDSSVPAQVISQTFTVTVSASRNGG
jgi:hypothetical protein